MHSKPDKTALALIVAYVLVLIFVGWKVQAIETPNSAVRDGYAGKADEILAGEIPRDPYRSLFHPVPAAAGVLPVCPPRDRRLLRGAHRRLNDAGSPTIRGESPELIGPNHVKKPPSGRTNTATL